MYKTIIAPLLLILIIAAPPTFAGSKIYKWVDGQGGIHYGANPPLNSNAEEVTVHGGPAGAQGPATANADSTPPGGNGEKADASSPKKDEGPLAKNAETIKENCKIAKQNLAVLRNDSVKRFRDADGKVVRYSEEDRQKRIKDAQDYVDQFCSK